MVKAKKYTLYSVMSKRLRLARAIGKGRIFLWCIRAGMLRNHREAGAFIRVEDELPLLLANFDNLVCCL